MTKEQLFKLGYVRWLDEYPIYLIPISRFKKDFSNKEEEVFSIRKCRVKVKDMKLDTKFGLLAYGVYPDD